ncbi:HPr kinase/phosphorylase [Yoonia sp. SS1-5]|uniref:HPr kinase/phosphorylase n=1 Tax=Yoonia rhodophyticola TaxID=3137370 RepID=A0AAN0MKQ8_9RHOB
MALSDADQPVHASCVAWQSQGVLITGASGAGKSALALILMGFGCDLVADDRVCLRRAGDRLLATAPDTTQGLIEARGIGILQAQPRQQAEIVLMVDLDQTSAERLPPRRKVTVLGLERPLIYGVTGPHFAPAIIQILKAGWSDR